MIVFGADREELARLLVGDQVELAAAVAGLGVLEPVELVGRRPQALGEQAASGRPAARARRAAGRKRRPSTPTMSPRSRSTRQLEGLLAEHVLAGVELDLAAAVAEVEEGGLAVSAAGDEAAGDPVARLGLDPRRAGPRGRRAPRRSPRGRRTRAGRARSPPPAGARASRAARGERRRASALASRASPVGRSRGRVRDSGLSILVILSFFFGPRGDLDGDDVVALVADQGLADRRLVGELVLGGLASAEPTIWNFCESPDFWSLTWTTEPNPTSSVLERPSRRSRSRAAAAPRAGRSAARASPARSWRRRTRSSRRCRRTRAPP